MHQHLGVGEKATAPSRQPHARSAQFVVKDVARLRVGSGFGPCLLHHLNEAGKTEPEILKLESARSAGSAVIGKQQRTVIRK